MKKLCCVCRKTNGPEGWDYNPGSGLEVAKYGLCPDCYERTVDKIMEVYSSGGICDTVIIPRTPAMVVAGADI